MLRKCIGIVVCLMMVCSTAVAGSSVAIYERDRNAEVRGWSVYASDDDIDDSAELITELDTTYAQLAAEDNLEVLSASGSDITQTVTVTGINSAGKKVSEDFTLVGATAQTSTATFRYVDQVSVDAECAGAITVRRAAGDTFITSIPIGTLDALMAQHFNGQYVSYITGWSGRCTSTTGTVLFELRWYPDDSDCLDAGDGYRVLDAIQFTNVLGSDIGVMGEPIRLPAGGYIAVYGLGGAVNSDGSVTIQGVDVRY